MKKRFLIMLIIIMAVLVLTLVGCSNTSSPSQEQIPPSPEPTALKYNQDWLHKYPYEDDRLNVIFQNDYVLVDQNILRTDSIGLVSNPSDNNKEILVQSINHVVQSQYEVRFMQHNTQQIITVLEEWSKLDVVKYLYPIYSITTDLFSTNDIPPNDYYYYAQWGLSSTNGINVERAWQYTTGSNGTIKIGVFENNL
ncbi:MAG: hypothetical protein IK048_04910 [Clostridia bacterium]|nr:hypothetical protein [Clostridia bacterium]